MSIFRQVIATLKKLDRTLLEGYDMQKHIDLVCISKDHSLYKEWVKIAERNVFAPATIESIDNNLIFDFKGVYDLHYSIGNFQLAESIFMIIYLRDLLKVHKFLINLPAITLDAKKGWVAIQPPFQAKRIFIEY